MPKKNKKLKKAPKIEEDKVPRFDNKKFVRIAENEPQIKFKEIGDRVNHKEVKFLYFTTENNVGVYYYRILDNETKD